MSDRRRTAGVVLGAVVGLLVGLVGAAPQAAAAGPAPGKVAFPINRLHLESFENFNQLQVVDAANRVVRTIPIAGNPAIRKPSVCYTQSKYRSTLDFTGQWRLDWFTTLCAGRYVGSHSVPQNVYSGRYSMNPADLGKRPGAGAPLSHGCLRMRSTDAKYLFDLLPLGTPVYFITTPWRPWTPAVPTTPKPPTTPTALTVTPGLTSLTATWRPAVANGSAVTGYQVTVKVGRTARTYASARTGITVSGLLPGATYVVTVRATSRAGASPWTAPRLVVPYAAPAAPSGVTATVRPGGGWTIAWGAAPPRGAAVTRYEVRVQPSGPIVALPATARSYVLPASAATAGARVSVLAVNRAGRGAVALVTLPAPTPPPTPEPPPTPQPPATTAPTGPATPVSPVPTSSTSS